MDAKNIQKDNIEKTLDIYHVDEIEKFHEKTLTKNDTT